MNTRHHTVQLPKTRLLAAGLLAAVWIGWAVWANVPHFYDIQALQQELALIAPGAKLEPAGAGFPFAYMRYQYSQAGQLTPINLKPLAALPNVLFCLAGITSVVLLALRVRRLTIGFVGLLGLLLTPAAVSFILYNGLHSDIIAYVYLTPVTLLLACVAAERLRIGSSLGTLPERLD